MGEGLFFIELEEILTKQVYQNITRKTAVSMEVVRILSQLEIILKNVLPQNIVIMIKILVTNILKIFFFFRYTKFFS